MNTSHPNDYNCGLKEQGLLQFESPDSLNTQKNKPWQIYKGITLAKNISFTVPLTSIELPIVKPRPLNLELKKLDHLRIIETAIKLAERFYSLFHRSSTRDGTYHLSENKTVYNFYMGTVFYTPAEFGLWMPGIALIASQLAEKKRLQGLYICLTLEAFASRLQEISNNPNDHRCAFVVPAFMSGYNPYYKPNFPQHKCAVCVEKKNGFLTIALLDAQPDRTNCQICPARLKNDIWEDYRKLDEFNSQEVIFRAILIGIKGVKEQIRLMHSQVIREIESGCSVFALKDAIAFLRDPDFFKKLEFFCLPTKIDEQRQIEVITRLPPECMVGTQSYKLLNLYQSRVTEGALNSPLIGKKSNKSLKTVLEENQAVIQTLDGKKLQNHYITKKIYKYMHSIIHAIETMPPKDIQSLANKTLLTKENPNLFSKQILAL